MHVFHKTVPPTSPEKCLTSLFALSKQGCAFIRTKLNQFNQFDQILTNCVMSLCCRVAVWLCRCDVVSLWCRVAAMSCRCPVMPLHFEYRAVAADPSDPAAPCALVSLCCRAELLSFRCAVVSLCGRATAF